MIVFLFASSCKDYFCVDAHIFAKRGDCAGCGRNAPGTGVFALGYIGEVSIYLFASAAGVVGDGVDCFCPSWSTPKGFFVSLGATAKVSCSAECGCDCHDYSFLVVSLLHVKTF